MPLTSSLIPAVNSIKSQILALWLSVSSNKTIIATAANKKISLPAALAFMSLYLIYNKFILPPPQIRHLPRAGFFEFVSSISKKRPYDEILKEITGPLAAKTDHGMYTAFSLVTGWAVYVTRPEAAKKLLLKTDLFPKHAPPKDKKDTILSKFIMGPNIISLPQGMQWKNQRIILNPAFHRSMPIQLFGELSQKLFVEWDKEVDLSSIDVFNFMTRWTLDVIGIAGFDFNFNAIEEKNNEWVDRYHHIIKATFSPFFLLFPFFDSPDWGFLFPKRKQSHDELDLFLNKMQEIIVHKRQILENSDGIYTANKSTNEKDLLTLMLEAAKEENGKITDEEIKSNLCGFFIAGHDTTATAISNAMYNLATHPEVQEKAREEAIRVLGDQPEDVLPTWEQIKEMPYIQMVIKETLRRNTVLQSILARVVTEDTDLAGCVLSKGTRVGIDMMALHRNPLIWEDPETFKPERFAPGGEAEAVNKKHGTSWIPFSNGARMCIGVNFSLNEQRVFLPMLLRKYELSLPDDSDHKEKLITTAISILKPVNLQINLKRLY
ncbi:cytochrome P450 [Circinella umbellata]|nr:cytochrome P450 [Circinella umbellata]